MTHNSELMTFLHMPTSELGRCPRFYPSFKFSRKDKTIYLYPAEVISRI